MRRQVRRARPVGRPRGRHELRQHVDRLRPTITVEWIAFEQRNLCLQPGGCDDSRPGIAVAHAWTPRRGTARRSDRRDGTPSAGRTAPAPYHRRVRGRGPRSWRCPHPVRRRAHDRASPGTNPVRHGRGTRAARSTRRSPRRCRGRGRWPASSGGGRARRRAGVRGGRRARPRAHGSRRRSALPRARWWSHPPSRRRGTRGGGRAGRGSRRP